jgi:hypothetical protein
MGTDRSNAIRTLIHFTEGNEGNEEGFGTIECSGRREHFVRVFGFPANHANERGAFRSAISWPARVSGGMKTLNGII